MSPCQRRSEHSHRAWLVTDRFVIAGGSLSRGQCLNISPVTFFFFGLLSKTPGAPHQPPSARLLSFCTPRATAVGFTRVDRAGCQKAKTDNKNYNKRRVFAAPGELSPPPQPVHVLLHASGSPWAPFNPFPRAFPLLSPPRPAPPRRGPRPLPAGRAALRCGALRGERAVWATCWA